MRIPDQFVMPVLEGYVGHSHFWERAMSRRQFIGTTAAASGVALSSPLWAPLLAEAAGTVEPRPIPQRFDDSPFHFQFLGPTAEPSSITDFRGVIGGADLLGTGWGTDTLTGKRTHLFTAVDNRFMKGTYVGVDGRKHHATFGFVWLDVFSDESRHNQIHDFNLDIRPFPGGLFWTNRVPNSSVDAEGDEFEDGASWHVKDLALFDYFTVANALKDGDSIDATVSYSLRWAGGGKELTSDDGTNFHFEGRQTTATIEWSAREKGFRFHSDPSRSTQHTNFAQVGQERNGVFYSADD